MSDHIMSFDNFDDMLAYLDGANRQATAALSEEQRSITWGSYTLGFHLGVPIFGYILTRDELRESELRAGGELDEVNDMLANTEINLTERGRAYGRFYSEIEPDGEWGSNHKLNLWPSTQAIFEGARDWGWNYELFPAGLQGSIQRLARQFMRHRTR